MRCLVRDPDKARSLATRGMELHRGDVLDADLPSGSRRGRRGRVSTWCTRWAAAGRRISRSVSGAPPSTSPRWPRARGSDRVVYLGGLGDHPQSKHLRSRHRTAQLLAENGPPLTYFRAGMVVGAGSESYRTLRYLVQRLPVMIAPAWLETPTQPIAIDDVVSYLALAPDVPASRGREIQIGGPDVLSYGDMLDRMAEALGITDPPQAAGAAAHPLAVLPVDRPRHPGRRGDRAAADRGALDADHGHRPLGRCALRRRPDSLPRRAAPGAWRRTRRRPPCARPESACSTRRSSSCTADGPLESIHSAELLPAQAASVEPDRRLLERAGDSYWRYLGRRFLGVIRAVSQAGPPAVVLLVRSLVLLRFGTPRYARLDRGGSMTWPIVDGLLVSREGRERGFLRLSIERTGEDEAPGARDPEGDDGGARLLPLDSEQRAIGGTRDQALRRHAAAHPSAARPRASCARSPGSIFRAEGSLHGPPLTLEGAGSGATGRCGPLPALLPIPAVGEGAGAALVAQTLDSV